MQSSYEVFWYLFVLEKMTPPLPKPEAVDENQRREHLEEVKKKFKSRRFRADSSV